MNKTIEKACNYFQVTKEELLKSYVRAPQEIAFARHIVFYLLKANPSIVGRVFNVNRTTVIYGRKKIKDFISINDKETINALKNLN